MTINAQERSSGRPFLVLCALVALALAASVLLRLSTYGIWDPWELAIADAARKLGEGAQTERPTTLTLRLVQASFAVFGTREWAGRLPMALSGLALLAAGALWVRRQVDGRAGLYAALALGTTPLFLLHSREMIGATPSFLCAALIAIGASNAVFPARVDHADGAQVTATPFLWLLLALIGGVGGAYAAGVLLVVLPPLAAVACVALYTGVAFDATRSSAHRSAALIVIGAAAVVGALVVRAVVHHGSDYSVWTGGVPLDEAVPTFEVIVSHLFHGLAPFSAAAPVAIGAALWRTDPSPSDAPLRLTCVLWGAFAYAAATVYLSTYGAAAYPAPLAIAILVALWLRDLERDQRSFWPELVIVLLMLGLIIRDYALYPSSPFDALELSHAQAPEKFNPKLAWIAVLGAFGLALALSCMATTARGTLDLKAPYRGLRASWHESSGHRGWLVCFALVWLGLLLFGVLGLTQVPGVKLSSLARRIGRYVGLVALLVPVLVALGQVAYHEARRLARVRNVPVLIAALLAGLYTSQVFLPGLSAHFSPREVFDSFAKLAKKDEPLAQFQVQGRAAAYYVDREVRDIANQDELIAYLAEPGRRWALLPSDRLADVDMAYRKRVGRHLFVPQSENARVVLVGNEPAEGTADENPLTKYVLKEAPKVQHPINANFEGMIELIGYDLELPQTDSVGAGQSFTVVWVFRALRGNLQPYQAFLHVDSEGQRINGDHDPVDGMYPVRLWTEGDVVVDRQRISVPATTSPGTYTMYTGFFRGETRLKVVSGPKDDSDRVLAGTVQIR